MLPGSSRAERARCGREPRRTAMGNDQRLWTASCHVGVGCCRQRSTVPALTELAPEWIETGHHEIFQEVTRALEAGDVIGYSLASLGRVIRKGVSE